MDYDSNSNSKRKAVKEKQERPKVERVVTGEVIERKPGIATKFKRVFFGGDFKSAARYVGADVILPAVRNMLADASKGAVDRVIYGEVRRPNHYDGRPNYAGRIQYNNPINRAARPDPRDRQRPSHVRQGYGDPTEILIPDRDQAALVLERLMDILDQYDTACLADFKDLVGIASHHVDQKWGWTNLHGAQIVQTRDGYLLQLPELEDLSRLS